MNLGRSLVLPLLLVVASCGPDHRVGGSLDWMTDTARGALDVGETVAVEPLPVGDQESVFTGADALDLVVVPRHRLRSLVESGWIRVRPGWQGPDEYAVPVAAALVGVSGAPQEWWEEPRTWSWLLADDRDPPVGLGRVDVRTALGVALLAVGAEPGSRHRDDLASAAGLVTSRVDVVDGPTVTLGGEPAVETLLHELVAVVPIDSSDPTWAWEQVDEWTAADDVLRPGWVRPEGDDPRTWSAPVGEFARAARLWRTWDRGPSLAEVRALLSGGTDAADRVRAD